ncbi:MAG TPA: hypothetical protein PKY31_01150 [Spirochaetota bacterium]|nr:hypothetical protein [Spirochaetota bacterium]
MKKYIKVSVLVLSLVLFGAIFLYLTSTVNVLSPGAPGFTPARDDAAARGYAPTLISNDAFGFPLKCYYRAARDGAGNLHIAYHPVWERERNDSGGLMPLLSRMFYTGGLRIQRVMFGKGDVEVIAVTVDAQGGRTEIRYERPKDYNPSTFTVQHENVTLRGTFSTTPVFRVSSWNHLFEKAGGADAAPRSGERAWKCEPEYFTGALWEEYTMVRLKETRLRKSRAHFEWERTAAE